MILFQVEAGDETTVMQLLLIQICRRFCGQLLAIVQYQWEGACYFKQSMRSSNLASPSGGHVRGLQRVFISVITCNDISCTYRQHAERGHFGKVASCGSTQLFDPVGYVILTAVEHEATAGEILKFPYIEGSWIEELLSLRDVSDAFLTFLVVVLIRDQCGLRA